ELHSFDMSLDDIRAFAPKPSAWTTFASQRLLVHQACQADPDVDRSYQPGQLHVAGNKLFVKTIDGWLQLLQLQPEGKKAMDASSFINGYQPQSGQFFVNFLTASSSGAPAHQFDRKKLVNRPVWVGMEYALFLILSLFLSRNPADWQLNLLLFVPLLLYSTVIIVCNWKQRKLFGVQLSGLFSALASNFTGYLAIVAITAASIPILKNLSVFSHLFDITDQQRQALIAYMVYLAPAKSFLFHSFSLVRHEILSLHWVNDIVMNSLLFALAHAMLGIPIVTLLAFFIGLIISYQYLKSPHMFAAVFAHLLWGITLLYML
ncbi:MAG TPA: hypothetical protein PKL83_05380, partial [bacterium]|nr:hypothetical protein [bacterium]